MSDEQDTSPKRKRGRPPGSGKSRKGQPAPTLLNEKRRQYSYGLMQRIRERTDPDLLIDFHNMILEGKSPIWDPLPGGGHRVIQDPSPLAVTPSLSDKIQSIKWLTERGYGLPVQSIQVDAEYRASLELLGSGVPTQVLENYDPQVLFYVQKALQLASGKSEEDVIDAEFTDTSTNSPPVDDTSELVSEIK